MGDSFGVRRGCYTTLSQKYYVLNVENTGYRAGRQIYVRDTNCLLARCPYDDRRKAQTGSRLAYRQKLVDPRNHT